LDDVAVLLELLAVLVSSLDAVRLAHGLVLALGQALDGREQVALVLGEEVHVELDVLELL
jgi:hypothetical protein